MSFSQSRGVFIFFVSVPGRRVAPPVGGGYPSDFRGRKYTVHHPTADGSQGRVRALATLPLEHHEEAVVQFLDAGGLALPVRFQECAASRLQRQKTRKDDERVLECHRHTLAATHFVPSCALLSFRRRNFCGQQTVNFAWQQAPVDWRIDRFDRFTLAKVKRDSLASHCSFGTLAAIGSVAYTSSEN